MSELMFISEDDLIQIFDERIAPLYARTTTRTIRSILVNIAYRIPELVVLSPELSDRELREEVVRVAMNAGYAYSSLRGTASIIARFIREVAREWLSY